MSRAFTLIEMLVAVSIAALILGMGMIAYSKVARKQSLDQTAAGVAQILTQARANALSGNKSIGCTTLSGWRVTFTANNYTLREVCSAGAASLQKTVPLPASITVTSFPSPNPILFKVLNQGTTISGSTSITLTNSKDMTTKSVTVSKLGVIQ